MRSVSAHYNYGRNAAARISVFVIGYGLGYFTNQNIHRQQHIRSQTISFLLFGAVYNLRHAKRKRTVKERRFAAVYNKRTNV
jgi:uncharacterized membrane protein YbjE (DUF340 family)